MILTDLQPENKNRSDDRILVLAPIEGQKPRGNNGIVDPRLFQGEDNLHAVLGPDNLWSMKYSKGTLPEPLRQRFTTFQRLLDYAEGYFKRRGVRIVEVKD